MAFNISYSVEIHLLSMAFIMNFSISDIFLSSWSLARLRIPVLCSQKTLSFIAGAYLEKSGFCTTLAIALFIGLYSLPASILLNIRLSVTHISTFAYSIGFISIASKTHIYGSAITVLSLPLPVVL